MIARTARAPLAGGRAVAVRALPVLYAVAMVATAGLLGEPSLLFPEGIALALGVWVTARPDWLASRWRIAVLPTACAALGVLVGLLPGPRSLLAIVALAAALVLLILLRSRLSPALSAAVLPVWFGTGDSAYVVLVAAMCTLLAVTAPRAPVPVRPVRWPARVLAVFGVCACGWLALVPVLGLLPLAAAPPLLVACLEFVQAGAAPGPGVRRWALLSVAGAAGVAAAVLVQPGWVAVAVALTVVSALMWAFRAPVPPALATVLVPFVAGVSDPLTAALTISLGAAVLLAAAAGLRWAVDRSGPGGRRATPRSRHAKSDVKDRSLP